MIGRSRLIASLLAPLLAPLLLGACVPEEPGRSAFAHLHYRNVSSAPGSVRLRPLEVEMERGLAVRARISAIGVNGEPLPLLDLRSGDPSVFVVELGPKLGEYVLYGVEEGETEMDVYSDMSFEASIPVTIVSQDP